MNREEGASAICNNNQIVLTLKMGTINAQHTAAVTSAMRRAAAVATPRSRYRGTARRPRRIRRRRHRAAAVATAAKSFPKSIFFCLPTRLYEQ